MKSSVNGRISCYSQGRWQLPSGAGNDSEMSSNLTPAQQWPFSTWEHGSKSQSPGSLLVTSPIISLYWLEKELSVNTLLYTSVLASVSTHIGVAPSLVVWKLPCLFSPSPASPLILFPCSSAFAAFLLRFRNSRRSRLLHQEVESRDR